MRGRGITRSDEKGNDLEVRTSYPCCRELRVLYRVKEKHFQILLSTEGFTHSMVDMQVTVSDLVALRDGLYTLIERMKQG